jgi:hypothetical protein
VEDVRQIALRDIAKAQILAKRGADHVVAEGLKKVLPPGSIRRAVA